MKATALSRLDLAGRIALDDLTGSWFVVGITGGDDASLLAEEIESLVDHDVLVVEVATSNDVVEVSRRVEDAILVLAAPAGIDPLRLDACRSMLERTRPAVLFVPMADLARMVSAAPHFTSWIGNRVFVAEDDRYLSEQARLVRLIALREHFEMDDDEFIARLQRGQLGIEPEHIEWVVLLGRQDLLESPR